MTTVVLRQVPGSSPIHRLWAGTKLIAVLLISITIVVAPSWASIGLVVGVLVVAGVIGRVPPTAVPRPPWWIWALFLVGALINLPLGLDAVLLFLRSTVFAFVLLGASMMIGWTTSMSDIAPAVAILVSPLKKLKLPVDEWAATLALCLRSLPLLIDEMRTMIAARKLRPKSVLNSASDNSIVDLITATMSIAIRRATEMGEAITARGGTGQITAHPSRPGLSDALALAVVALCCTAGIVLTFV
ncbi:MULTISPECIES: energy-coupling factor transporter transmembrane component T family protein [Nocardiaceae]|jgi:energy-coupling factor transport system permease protein|uniref:energy-coupling factor transporter transmembrane component T family protein n=1 Tax=Nocardiaceae TaxID=85025 RepID=UPI00055DDFA2|nr:MULTISPECIES: energy-coupling factor transporter transmembrane protein EcfT [Rhodococcus]OZF05421.1 energy-coupling factor transporter transmembrane protein EcfT [Rhodococcus sp. 15-1189-1-1a]OZF20207.1 energy-coupling factor transporter transmembrane protein EcfT [Rhodococcus sp. 14-2686-1-2]OZF56327.1 energy-coupling factor transporter transmembrane protein EcfT [Rhodococcus sp. 14-2470-1b]